MNTEKYIVHLVGEEREQLETIVKKRKGTSQKVNRALTFLHADANGPDWSNEQIALRCKFKTVQKTHLISNSLRKGNRL